MTDKELKNLVASLAINQEKRDAAQAKREEVQEKRDEKYRLLQERRDAAQEKRDAEQSKRDEEFKKRAEEFRASIKKFNESLGNLNANIGYGVEHYFYNSLEKSMMLGNIKFDLIAPNVKYVSKTLQGEFDVLMFNGDSIGIIECKHRIHLNDISDLTGKKLTHFRSLFPQYAKYKIYLGLGATPFPPIVEHEAKKLGIAILKCVGEFVTIYDKNLKVF